LEISVIKEAAVPERLRALEMILVPEFVMLAEGPVRDRAMVIRDGRFVQVSSIDEAVAAFPGLEPTMLPRCLMMPGLVDAHHHLTQAFGKALAFGEPSEIYRRIWVPLEGALDAEGAFVAAKLAALESLRGGFTTVADAGTRGAKGLDAVARAVKEAGLRCVLAKF
jgi:cytosine/adenosine deaminase-related metal-dependent hydrolase